MLYKQFRQVYIWPILKTRRIRIIDFMNNPFGLFLNKSTYSSVLYIHNTFGCVHSYHCLFLYKYKWLIMENSFLVPYFSLFSKFFNPNFITRLLLNFIEWKFSISTEFQMTSLISPWLGHTSTKISKKSVSLGFRCSSVSASPFYRKVQKHGILRTLLLVVIHSTTGCTHGGRVKILPCLYSQRPWQSRRGCLVTRFLRD